MAVPGNAHKRANILLRLMSDFNKDVTFSIIGAGRVGVTLGTMFERAGHKIIGCSARTINSLERAARYLKCPSSTNALDVIDGADCILIAVPDDSLAGVAEVLAEKGLPEGTFVVHAAGSIGLDPLAALEEQGCRILAIHVLQSVPDVESGLQRVPGSWFGTTCAEDLKPWAEAYVETLQGKVWWVDERDRVLYHAAAAITSNYLLALAAMVEQLGLDPAPYIPLMRGTLDNLERLGPLKALTGPVVRGDSGTVLRHMLELEQVSPEVAATYKAMALQTLLAAENADRIDASAARSVREVLTEPR